MELWSKVTLNQPTTTIAYAYKVIDDIHFDDSWPDCNTIPITPG